MAKENNAAEPEKVQADLPEVEQELSKVATNPKQSIIILVVVAGVFLYLFFNLFISSDEAPKQESTPVPDNVVKPVQIPVDTAIPAIPALPTPPKLEDPALPPPPLYLQPRMYYLLLLYHKIKHLYLPRKILKMLIYLLSILLCR